MGNSIKFIIQLASGLGAPIAVVGSPEFVSTLCEWFFQNFQISADTLYGITYEFEINKTWLYETLSSEDFTPGISQIMDASIRKFESGFLVSISEKDLFMGISTEQDFNNLLSEIKPFLPLSSSLDLQELNINGRAEWGCLTTSFEHPYAIIENKNYVMTICGGEGSVNTNPSSNLIQVYKP